MYKLLKVFILLFVLCLLDNNVLYIKSGLFFANVYADSPTTVKEEAKLQEDRQAAGYDTIKTSDRASNPMCLGGVVIVLVTVAAAIGLILAQAYIIGAAVLLGAIASSVMLFGCLYAFVRNPVLRNVDGNYKECAEALQPLIKNDSETPFLCPNNNYKICSTKTTDGPINNESKGLKAKECEHNWPQNKAPYGEYIEFCHRNALGGLRINEDINTVLDSREIEFSKWPGLVNAKLVVGGEIKCATLANGESTNIHGVTYKASYRGGNLCVDAWGLGSTPWLPQSQIGCHLRNPAPPPPMCERSKKMADGSWDNTSCFNCYIAPACYGGSSGYTHAFLPMTSTVVECVKESLENVLNGNCTNVKIGAETEGFLVIARKRLAAAVQAVIVLAIIIFGFKLMLGAVQGPQEWGMFIIKIILIIFFALGTGMQFYYGQLIKLSTGIADIVQSAGGIKEICDFKTSDYKNIRKKFNTASFTANEQTCYNRILGEGNIHDISAAGDFTMRECNLRDPRAFLARLEVNDYSYLAIWDRLDCRMSFYLGQSLISVGAIAGGTAVTAIPVVGGILAIVLALVYAGQILIAIIAFIFIFMMILTMIWMAQLFIIALIILSILALFAPIFIPMCLFQITKNFFDAWIKELITYSLYPVILFGFLSLTFSVFDTLFFTAYKPTDGSSATTLVFKREVSSQGTRSVFNYYLDPGDQCSNPAKENILACIINSISFVTKPLILGIDVTSANIGGDTSIFWQKLGMMALMGFLFWHFLGILGSLAAELAGNFRGDISKNVMSPQAMAKRALATAIRVGKAIATEGESEVERAKGDAMERLKTGNKPDQGLSEDQKVDKEFNKQTGEAVSKIGGQGDAGGDSSNASGQSGGDGSGGTPTNTGG